MGKFMSHEPLAQGMFNIPYNCAYTSVGAWKDVLENTEPILLLLCDRMESDWQNLAPRMRKHWQAGQVDAGSY